MCSNIGNSKCVGKAHDLFTLYSQGRGIGIGIGILLTLIITM
jgi:hypothetical protein